MTTYQRNRYKLWIVLNSSRATKRLLSMRFPNADKTLSSNHTLTKLANKLPRTGKFEKKRGIFTPKIAINEEHLAEVLARIRMWTSIYLHSSINPRFWYLYISSSLTHLWFSKIIHPRLPLCNCRIAQICSLVSCCHDILHHIL